MNTNTFEMYSNTNMNTLLFFPKVFEYDYRKCIQILVLNTNMNTPGLVPTGNGLRGKMLQGSLPERFKRRLNQLNKH